MKLCHIERRCLICLSVFLAGWISGCLPPDSSKPKPGPDDKPTPDTSPIAAAADRGMADYRAAAANVCQSLRERASSFNDWPEFQQTWEKENQGARIRAFGLYAEAVNAGLFERAADGSWKTDVPIDTTKLEQVLRDAEIGFRGK